MRVHEGSKARTHKYSILDSATAELRHHQLRASIISAFFFFSVVVVPARRPMFRHLSYLNHLARYVTQPRFDKEEGVGTHTKRTALHRNHERKERHRLARVKRGGWGCQSAASISIVPSSVLAFLV